MRSVADPPPAAAEAVTASPSKRVRKRRHKHSHKPSNHVPKSKLTLARIQSAVTNGSAILDQVDHRSAWMRRLRDLIDTHTSDLGGDDAVTEGERRLIRRCAMMTLQLEMQETHWAANDGEASIQQLETYQRVTGALRRTLESLGLQRRQKTVRSFGQLLREDAEKQQREDAEKNERKRAEFERRQREQRQKAAT